MLVARNAKRWGGRAWSNAPVSKTGGPSRVPGVRIPPPPPSRKTCSCSEEGFPEIMHTRAARGEQSPETTPASAETRTEQVTRWTGTRSPPRAAGPRRRSIRAPSPECGDFSVRLRQWWMRPAPFRSSDKRSGSSSASILQVKQRREIGAPNEDEGRRSMPEGLPEPRRIRRDRHRARRWLGCSRQASSQCDP